MVRFFSSGRRLVKSSAPAVIANSGLRRSWPSTAMNCSRSSAMARSFCRACSVFWAFSSLSIWIDSKRAKDSIIGWMGLPLSAAGWGSNAQIVPKKLPSVRNTGTEI
ncbi:hypothetical protein D9M71_444310 [compost metagenome]